MADVGALVSDLADSSAASDAGGGILAGIGGGLSSIGSSITSALTGSGAAAAGAAINLEGTKLTNAQSLENLQSVENWEEMMSNTSYSRAVAGLKAAGLNPALAYSQGGASTPTVQAAPVQNVLGSAVAGGQTSARTAADIANTQAQTEIVQDQGQNLRSQSELASANASVAAKTSDIKDVDVERAIWEKENIWPLELRRAQADANSAEADAAHRSYGLVGDANEARFQKDVSDLPQWGRLLEGTLNSAHGAWDLGKKIWPTAFGRK